MLSSVFTVDLVCTRGLKNHWGPRVIGPRLTEEVIRALLAARFSNADRHRRRPGEGGKTGATTQEMTEGEVSQSHGETLPHLEPPKGSSVPLRFQVLILACPSKGPDCVTGAVNPDARRGDAGDARPSSRSQNKADGLTPTVTRRENRACGRSLRCSSSKMTQHRLPPPALISPRRPHSRNRDPLLGQAPRSHCDKKRRNNRALIGVSEEECYGLKSVY